MNAELTSLILLTAIGFGLWWLYFVEFKKYLVDSTRQKLFDTRDELFRKAEAGIISFDDDAYGITRTTINGMIRFIHEHGMMRIIVSWLTIKFLDQEHLVKKYKDSWEAAYSKLDNQAAQKAIMEVHRKMHTVVALHVLKSSVLMMAILIPILVVVSLFTLRRRARFKNDVLLGDKARARWSYLDAEANHIGHSFL